MPDRAALFERGTSRERTQLPTRDRILPITLLGFVLRFIVVCVVARTCTAAWFFGQATELGCLAHSAASGQGLSSPFCSPTGPSAFLAPGYPLLIAAIFRVFGDYTLHSALCVMLLQTLFSALTIPAAMWTARLVFRDASVANLAGILCALNPWLIGMEAAFWETTLSILLITALVGLAVALQQNPSRPLWFAAAITLAFATAVNPSLCLTGIALLTVASLLSRNEGHRLWAVPVLLFLALSALWPIRNLHSLHAFVPLRDNVGYELWQGNRPAADGFFDETLHPNASRSEHHQFVSQGELSYMQGKSRVAKAWIANHPARFAALTLLRAGYFWTGVRRESSAILILSTTLLTCAGLASLCLLLLRDRRTAILFTVPLLILPLPYYVTHPDFRFWCVLAPTLSILAAWGAIAAWRAPGFLSQARRWAFQLLQSQPVSKRRTARPDSARRQFDHGPQPGLDGGNAIGNEIRPELHDI